MNTLPDPETLASLVSEAAENMWGVPFTLVADTSSSMVGANKLAHQEPLRSRIVMVEVNGAPPLSIMVSSDEQGGAALGGMMFSCTNDEVSKVMIDDSLCELANILAGQIKTLMAPTHQLGLPTILHSDDELSDSQATQARLRIGERDATVCVTVAAAA